MTDHEGGLGPDEGIEHPIAGDPSRPWAERLRAWREEVKEWSREEFIEQAVAVGFKTNEHRGGDKLEIGLDISRLKRWERGETKRPQAMYRRILAHMGAPLPAAPARSAPRTPPDSTPEASALLLPPAEDEEWRQSSDTAEIISQVTRKDLSLKRRDLGRLFGAMFVGPALLERIERLLATPLTQPPAGQALSVGYEEVGQIEQTAQILRTWDDQFGGGLQRKAVVGQLNEVSELLSEPQPPEIARRLHSAMAELAETAATMSWDSGEGAAAQGYYLMGLQAARTADDPVFAANVMAGLARQLLYLDRSDDALNLIRMAQDSSADRATPAVRSMLATREAWAYSKTGRVEAFRRATAAAESAFSEVKPGQEPHWMQYYSNNAAELHGTTGGRLLEMAHRDAKHATAAAERIEQAIDERPGGRLRSSALDEIGLAEAFLLQGEPEEAASRGHAAVETAGQTSSDRVKSQLRELYEMTSYCSKVPAIADLRDRIQPLCVPTSPGNA